MAKRPVVVVRRCGKAFSFAEVVCAVLLGVACASGNVVPGGNPPADIFQGGSGSGGVGGSGAGNELAGNVESNNVGPSASDGQYRAAYYYPPGNMPAGGNIVYSRLPNWNRDSYTDAAQDYGYGSDNSAGHQQNPQPYGTQPQGNSNGPPAFFSNDGDVFDLDAEGSSLGGAGAGLGGLAGLLGLKGLKGLGILGLLKGGFGLGLPLILLLGIPLLLILPLFFLFLPFPVITIPSSPTGRTFGIFRFADISSKMTNLARSVLESEKCIERISCEVSRVSRGSLFDRAMTRMIYRFENHMPSPLQRMARAYMDSPPTCAKYSCNLMAEVAAKKAS